MQDYEKLYTILFNACTDAVEAMDRMDFGMAKTLLICAQQEAEERYISAEECAETIHGTSEK
jgi:hypothetical protein